jgi:hypothetical protein
MKEDQLEQDYKYDPACPTICRGRPQPAPVAPINDKRGSRRIRVSSSGLFFLLCYVWPPALSPVAPNCQSTMTGTLRGLVLWCLPEILFNEKFYASDPMFTLEPVE